MTCGVTMLYYVLHTRPITEVDGIKGPVDFGSRCHLPAGRAVTEMQAAGLRLASARQLVAGLHDKSATMTTSAVVAIADGAKTDYATVYDNKLTRSVKYYRTLQAESEKRGGGFQRGIPFYVYIPL